jgi:hypothetical protein
VPGVALRGLEQLAVMSQVADHLVGVDVDHRGTDRHADDPVLTGLARHLPPHAVLAALRAERALVTEIDQGIEAFVGDEEDAAAVAAVAAVGPAKRNEFFAPETHAAAAAVAGVDGDLGFVDEFHLNKVMA